MFEKIKADAQAAITELLEAAVYKKGDIIVVGCSSSELVGNRIGKGGSADAALAVLEGIKPTLDGLGLYLAAQCCEHLNRALIIEREAAEKFGYDLVSVRPVPTAGGAFATAAFEHLADPVAVENVRAVAGIDFGGTLIGMHLKPVAVPVRLSVRMVGEASITAAYSRPKLIGGCRAVYE